MKYLVLLIVLTVVAGGFIFLNSIYPFSPRLANLTRSIGETIGENWQGFLFDKDEDEVEEEPSFADQTTQDYIRSEVDRIVDLKLKEIMSQAGGGVSSGLVVVPNDQSYNPDDIAQAFSDEVNVYPDDSGKSGVIVPIFKDGVGESFLYFLTPIKQ